MKKNKQQGASAEVTQTIAYLVESHNVDAAIKFAFEQEKNSPSAELDLYILYLLTRKDVYAQLIKRTHLLAKIEKPFNILEKLLSLLSIKGRFDLVIQIYKKILTGAKTINLNILNAQALTMLGFYDQAEKELRKIYVEEQSKSFSLGISKIALKAKAPELAIQVATKTQDVGDTENLSRVIDIALAKKQLGDLDGAIHTLSELGQNQNREISYLQARLHIDRKNFHNAQYLLESVLCVNENSDEQLVNLMWDFLSYSGDGKKLQKYAIKVFERSENQSWARRLLAKTYHELGLKNEKLQIVAESADEDSLSGYAMSSLYMPSIDEDEIFKRHLRAASKFDDSMTIKEKRPPNKKLRIGYVSSDFKNHSVFYFIYPILKNHDHKNFEIYAYYSGQKFDDYTHQVQNCIDHWRPIAYLDTSSLESLIHNDSIDVLIDLNGHTEGNRLDVFAKRVAPVQATWIGYPATTGLSNMDCRFTDEFVDNITVEQPFYVEKLISLSNTNFSVYMPPVCAPDITELPANKNGFVTFGSFNNYAKIHDETLLLWAQILSKIDNSRLVIKNKAMRFSMVRHRVLSLFKNQGIDENRLDLIDRDQSTEAHLRRIGRVDICLDTYPYSGTTTTCESLWMGAPVITLLGQHHRSRVSAGILSLLGMAEFIANSKEEYVFAAVNSAGNLNKLNDLRMKLRAVMQNSSIMQYKEFTENFESTIKELCEIK